MKDEIKQILLSSAGTIIANEFEKHKGRLLDIIRKKIHSFLSTNKKEYSKKEITEISEKLKNPAVLKEFILIAGDNKITENLDDIRKSLENKWEINLRNIKKLDADIADHLRIIWRSLTIYRHLINFLIYVITTDPEKIIKTFNESLEEIGCSNIRDLMPEIDLILKFNESFLTKIDAYWTDAENTAYSIYSNIFFEHNFDRILASVEKKLKEKSDH